MISLSDQAPRSLDSIAVVGGGPGGLLTAFLLQRQARRPLRITIFEAGCRLGGKILTPSFAAAPVRYEAGAAEFYDYTPVGVDPLRELVEDLGLPIVPLHGASVVVGPHTLSNIDDIDARLGPAARRDLEAFHRDARLLMNPREFYVSDEPGTAPGDGFNVLLDRLSTPSVRRYVETLVHSDLATEPERTSVSYGLQNYLMNDPAYLRLYAIAGGNEQLVTALVARLDVEVLRSRPVRQVRGLPDGRFRLTSGSSADRRDDDFDAVVLALPLAHLSNVGFSPGRLAGAMREHVRQHDHPAHYLRVTALFDRPFWRDRLEGSFAMLDAFEGCCLYDESSRDPAARHGVLGWLLAGAAAERLADLDDDALAATVLGSLPRSLEPGTAKLLETRVHRWVGAVNALPGGWRPHTLDRRHQPEPIEHPNLFVVGDYLFDSTLNGVLDSAAHVADWLAMLTA